MLKRINLSVILFFVSSFFACGQSDPGFDFKGYLKHMNIISVFNTDSLTTSSLFHNRLKFKWYSANDFSAALEIRNRMFYGEQIKLSPLLGKVLNQDNGLFDMAFLLTDQKGCKLVTNIDRAYLRWNKDNIDVQLGRQRINWGISLVWNPNDLFNAASFVDFDYEERSGTDALRIQYKTASLSGFEFIASPGKEAKKSIYALMYRFNKHKYDVQLFSAVYLSDIALGLGWAGSLKQLGFKGELTCFKSYEKALFPKQAINSSISFDYTFKGSNYFNISYLYNSNGSNTLGQPGNINSLYVNDVKHLSPALHSAFFQISRAFNPLITGSFSTIFLVGMNQFFLMPSINYSIKDDWDINLVVQSLLNNPDKKENNLTNLFLRLRWSF